MSSAPENDVAKVIVDAALKVHQALGPGLLESVYERALAHELRKRGRTVGCQIGIPVTYDGVVLGEGFKADVLVDGLVIVELKSVEKLVEAHMKQANTYVRLSGVRLGLLINFGRSMLKGQIVRIANGVPDYLLETKA